MGENLDMKLSHSIILVKRKNEDDLDEFTIEPITLSVKRQLKRQLMREEKKQRLRTYLQTSKSRDSRIVAGLVFESLAQLQLQEEVALTLFPMVRVKTPRSRNAKWKNRSRRPAGAVKPIQFKPTKTVEYNESTLKKKFRAGVFYVPMSSNQVAFDSFILVGQILYIFQFTIAASHDIKEGIMNFFSQAALMDKLQGAEWRFVFVIPPRSKIVCPESNVEELKKFWATTKLFTAEIDLYQAGQPQGGDGNSTDPDPDTDTDPDPDRSDPDSDPDPGPSGPYQTTRSQTNRASGSGKRKAEDVPPMIPIKEASSSKASKPSQLKARKARE